VEVLKIRPEQAEAFGRDAMTDFESRAVAHLRRKLPDLTEGLSDEQLRVRVKSCVPRAARYDLVTERQIICFVDTSYLLGEQFDTDPRHADVAEVLNRKDTDPDRRAGVIVGMALGRRHLANRGPGHE